ncbi:MAG: pyridoxal phosphate-dependent aminotransferase family protein [Candidatus Zixiibacteriota bacterium]|nr:MAG: pyridoxal phosphate-dependent aminotransferase family protein [candidate division Zixibacteria bacterium]
MDLFDKCFNFTRADEVKALGIYPYFHPISSAPGDEVIFDGRRVIMIGSNNYLGLTGHPKVKEAAAAAIQKYGSGCTGSRFLNGTLDLHIELEERLATFLKKEAALVFSTGFQTNLGTISCLVQKGDTLVIDRSDHASIVDGCRLSFGKVLKFAHNDMEDFERVIRSVRENNGKGGILVVVDGVFSMEGDIIMLPELVAIARKYNARVMVDDAHAVGVLGEGGRGTAEHYNMIDQVDMVMGTFSKSFASLGGYIAADNAIINYIKHFSRELIFSASIPPSSTAAVLAALDIIESEPERRKNLWKNARRMLREFKILGFDTGTSATPVIPVVIGEDLDTFKFWKGLFDNGILANPAISPAVPPGQALIRTSYTATHTDKHLDRVLEVFEKLGKKTGII